MSNFQRVTLNTNHGRYGYMQGGLGVADIKQANDDFNSLENHYKAQSKQEADQRLVTDLAHTGFNMLKTIRDPKAQELVAFLEAKGLDNSSLQLAHQYVQEHLSGDTKALRALDLMNDANQVNSHGVSDMGTNVHSNYNRVSTQVDPFTGHKTFTHTTSIDGYEESSVFAQQRNKKFDALAQHFDIVEE